jgi:hypothetical protein
MSRNDRNDYLWDRSGDPDPEIARLSDALAGLRAPATRSLTRRRLLAPAVLGVATAAVMMAIVASNRLPTQVVGLVSDERGTSAMIIEGGSRFELDVVTRGDQAAASERLVRGFEKRAFSVDERGMRFDVRYASPERLIVELPGDLNGVFGTRLLEHQGLYRPWELAVTSARSLEEDELELGAFRARDFDITGARYDDGVLEIDLSDAALSSLSAELPAGGSIALVDRSPSDRHDTAAGPDSWTSLGRIDGGAVRFETTDYFGMQVVRTIDAAHDDLLVNITSAQLIGPSLSPAQTWIARILFASFAGFLVFGIAAVAARRIRRLDPLVDRDDRRTPRRPVFVAALLTIAAIGAGLVWLGRGPFVGAAASVVDGPVDNSFPVGFGFSVVAAGFLLALVASVAVARWREDLVCGRRGDRFTRRGLAATAAVAVAVVIAVLFDAELDFMISAWPPADALGYAGTALMLVAAITALGARAIGGPWLCLAGAAAAAAIYAVGEALVTGQIGDDLGGGSVGIVALLIAGVSALTALLLSRPLGSPSAPVQAPIGGVMPFAIASCVGLLLHSSGELGEGAWAIAVLLIAPALTLLLGWLERSHHSLGPARVTGAESHRRAIAGGLGLTALWLGALFAADAVALSRLAPMIAITAVVATAIAMDLIAELRARGRRPQLAVAWSLHHPQLGALVERALDSQGFDVHLRARYLRGCLGILGAFAPISVMVDRDRIPEARELIAATLGCADVGE